MCALKLMKTPITLSLLQAVALLMYTPFNSARAAAAKASIVSVEASADTALTADPDSPFWKSVVGGVANRDNLGNAVVKDVMKVRSRWTNDNLYLLFSCTFSSLLSN